MNQQILRALKAPLVIVLGTVLVACSSQETTTSPELEKPETQVSSVKKESTAEEYQKTTPVLNVAETVHFEFDSSELTQAAMATLDSAIEKIQASEVKETVRLSVILEGYTDAVGPEEYNMNLSQRRAAAVKRYIDKHLDESAQWTLESNGETSPIAPNDTAFGRSQNRRVEVYIDSGVKFSGINQP